MNTSTALTAYTTHLNSQNDLQQQQIYYNRFIPYYQQQQQQLINTFDLQTTNNDFLDYSTQPFNIQTSSAADLSKPNFYRSQSTTIAKNHPITTKTTTNNNNKSYKLKRAFTDETTINNNNDKISPLNRSISLQDQIFQNEINSNFGSNSNNLGLNNVNSNFDPNSNLNSVNANNLNNSNSNFGVNLNLKIKTELFDSSASTTTQLSNNSSCYSATTTSIGCPSTALTSSPSTNERNTPFHNMDSNKMNINRPSSNLSSTIEQQQLNNNNTNNGILSETNITLWQFLLELLTSNEHSDLIQWTNKDGEFKVNILI